MKSLIATIIALILVAGAATACSSAQGAPTTSGSSAATTQESTSETTTSSGLAAAVATQAFSVVYTEEDLDDAWDASKATTIVLAGDDAQILGNGAVAKNGDVEITAGGVYVVSGALTDGQILVDSEDKETVRLVLNGADITCTTTAPIYVKSANKTIITLAEGTTNSITDGETYLVPDGADSEDDQPTAAVYCTSDLTINGGGSLEVDASYENGIVSKDELRITGGIISVEAANDAMRGRDSIGIKAGSLTLAAGGDGLQSNNDEGPEIGYIAIEGGTFTITAGHDGIQAETTLLITGGDFTITCGGGSANAAQPSGEGMGGFGRNQQATSTTTSVDSATTEIATETSDSAKALKAGAVVEIKDGTLAVDSADDAINSNNVVTIAGGTITLASGDDGIHADNGLTIDGGQLDVTTSYEGIESAEITINDGTIHILSTDDGINTSPSDSGTATTTAAAAAAGQGMQGPGGESGDNPLYVNGGYLAVDASGDGLDVAGPIEMTGGTVIVNGPTNDGNGPLDYLGELKITGGYLVATGSSGMAQAPSESSTQYSIMVNFAESQQAGTLVHIQNADGENVLTFAPTKQFQSVVLCSADLESGATYTVSLGGTSTGTAVDSLYSDGTYSGGTEYATLTLSSIVTTSGSAGMQGGGVQGGGMQGGGVQGGGTMPGGDVPSGNVPSGGMGHTRPTDTTTN